MRGFIILVIMALLAGCAQPAIVPVLEEGSCDEPFPADGVHALRVLSNVSFRDRSGFVRVIGDALNERGERLEFPFVRVCLFAEDGSLIDQVARPALRRVIPAGEATPFEVVVGTSRTVASHFVDVTAEEAGGMLPPTSTRVVSSDWAPEAGGVWWVTGEVGNEAVSVSARSVEVVVTVYDAAGGVIGAGAGFTVPAEIPPSGTASFAIAFDELRGVPVRYVATT